MIGEANAAFEALLATKPSASALADWLAAAAFRQGVLGDDAAWLQVIRNLLLARSLCAPSPAIAAGLFAAEKRLINLLAAAVMKIGYRAGGPPYRVVLLLGCLPADAARNSHLWQVCGYAAALALRPEIAAISVVVTHEAMLMEAAVQVRGLSREHERLFQLEMPLTTWPDEWGRALKAYAGVAPMAKVVVAAMPLVEGMAPYRSTLATIGALAPDAVIGFLGVIGARLAPYLLAHRVPMIAVQLNSLNPEPPWADLVLAQESAVSFSAKPRPNVWRDHVIPIIPIPRRETMPRSEVRGSERFLLVSALTNGRLERALARDDAALMDAIAAFLAAHSEVAWLFVGIEDAEVLTRRDATWSPLVAAGRLRWRGYASDLRAIYQHCDIYAQLPGTGGGGMGIAMAIAEGLPAVLQANQGTSAQIAPEYRYVGTDGLFACLAALILGGGLRSIATTQLARMVAAHALPAAGEQLLAFVEEARAREAG